LQSIAGVMARVLREGKHSHAAQEHTMFRKAVMAACLSLGFAAFSSTASAALIDTIEGNDCAGVFGQNFNECRIPTQYDPNQTPIIIKIEDGNFEINSALFPTIDGSEFDIDITGQGTGTWTYTPGAGDPLINFFVAKGGPNFNLFSNDGDPNSDSFFTPTNPNNNQPFGLSHLSFYDTATTVKVAEPATLTLLGLGLLGFALARRRRG
jgi:hypothetical protein